MNATSSKYLFCPKTAQQQRSSVSVRAGHRQTRSQLEAGPSREEGGH